MFYRTGEIFTRRPCSHVVLTLEQSSWSSLILSGWIKPGVLNVSPRVIGFRMSCPRFCFWLFSGKICSCVSPRPFHTFQWQTKLEEMKERWHWKNPTLYHCLHPLWSATVLYWVISKPSRFSFFTVCTRTLVNLRVSLHILSGHVSQTSSCMSLSDWIMSLNYVHVHSALSTYITQDVC